MVATDAMEHSLHADTLLAATAVAGWPRWCYWQGAFWHWDEGTYRRMERQQATYKVLSWLVAQGASSSSRKAELVLDAIGARTMRWPPKLNGWLERPADLPEALSRASWLPMQDKLVCPVGLAEGVAGAVRELDPRWLATARLPYRYEPEAECPQTMEWLAERIPNLRLREMFREFLGYWLTNDQGQQAVLVIAGAGKSGKSTLMNVTAAVLGADNVSNDRMEVAAMAEATRRHYRFNKGVGALLFALGVLVGGIAGGLIGWAWR